jgi:hypothetical protein
MEALPIWHAAHVTIELDRMLQRVVAEVFGSDVDVTYSADPKSPKVQRVELAAAGSGRRVGLRASYWWFDVTMLDLGVSATVFDEDDEEPHKEAALRALALVARAYLDGAGEVIQKRGIFGSRPLLRIVVDDQEWELGRTVSKAPPLNDA